MIVKLRILDLDCSVKWKLVELLERQIKITDDQIDRFVYELYGLTEEEIGVVEGG